MAEVYRCPFCLKKFKSSTALAKHLLNACEANPDKNKGKK